MRDRSCLSIVGSLIILAVAAITSGCSGFSNAGNNKSQSSATTYAYVSENGNASAVGQFQIASDGTLTALNPATVSISAGGPGWIAVDPSSNYFFAASNAMPNVINQFVISSDGTLAPNSAPSVNGGDGYYPFLFTADAKFTIVPNFANEVVSTFGLSSSGSLSPIGTYFTGQDPISAAIDASGKFVYIGCVGNGYGTIYSYSLGSDGSLTPLSPAYVPAGPGVANLAVSPKGFLYAVNSGDGTVTAFQIDESTGAIANAGSYPSGTSTGGQPNWIAFDPTGKYAYVSNFNDNSISQFVVDATTGALTMSAPDVATGNGPFQVAVDPSGMFVYTPNFRSGSVSQFKISATGTLIPNGSLSLGAPYQVVPLAIAFAQR